MSQVSDVILANQGLDRKSTRLNSSHGYISYAVFCLKKKKKTKRKQKKKTNIKKNKKQNIYTTDQDRLAERVSA